MGCCGSESSCGSSQLNITKRPDPPWWAGLLFKCASLLFHSVYARSSQQRHNRVMRLFQKCSDYGHVMACSVYGHILLYRGVTMGDKSQGMHYLSWAADAGEVKACYQLAELICNQEYGLTYMPNKVFLLYLLAAKAGHGLAENKLIALNDSVPNVADNLVAEHLISSEDVQWLAARTNHSEG